MERLQQMYTKIEMRKKQQERMVEGCHATELDRWVLEMTKQEIENIKRKQEGLQQILEQQSQPAKPIQPVQPVVQPQAAVPQIKKPAEVVVAQVRPPVQRPVGIGGIAGFGLKRWGEEEEQKAPLGGQHGHCQNPQYADPRWANRGGGVMR
jgi:hypothetical protein